MHKSSQRIIGISSPAFAWYLSPGVIKPVIQPTVVPTGIPIA